MVNNKIGLEDKEEILLVVNPQSGIMMHSNDLIKILVAIFFVSIGFYVGFSAGHLLFTVFGLVVICLVFYAAYLRYSNTVNRTYIITSKRILFLKRGLIESYKRIIDIESFTFENSGNDRGYIILGQVEPLLTGRGISFTEDKYVLDNLSNFKEVSELIKKLSAK